LRACWEAVGLKTLYVGDEAVVCPASFSLEGRSVRKLRQSVNRLERRGFGVGVCRAVELDDATSAAVARVSLADVVRKNAVTASADIVAADSYAATLFGLKGTDVPYLPASAAMGLWTLHLKTTRIAKLNV
jgi:hypothetical protein